MRRRNRIGAAVAAAALGVALAFGAAAQTGVSEEPTLDFRARPSEDDVAAFFPRDAYRSGQAGKAMLCCLVTGNDRLQCAVVAEAPAGLGFGEAARRVSLEVRLTRESAEAWRTFGEPVRLPIMFSNPRFAPPPAYDPAPRCGTRTYDPEDEQRGGEEVLSAER
ncbi:MAG: hypothetical protein GC206_11930 [Alphaproteobacteria bacterium]|nr:hypothetical protein [Alphaproteobacteria bacterium]